MANQALEEKQDSRSLGDLFGELATETSTLIKQEIKLVSIEVGRNLRSLSNSLIKGAVAFMLATCGLIFISAGVTLILSYVIPLWLAAFIVGGIAAGVAYAMLKNVQAELELNNIAPVGSMDTIKEDAKWIKDQIAQ